MITLKASKISKLLLLVVCWLLLTSSYGQEQHKKATVVGFSELNFGIAFLPDGNSLSNHSTVFPGLSFTWGETFYHDSKFIFEYQIGFALPTLATAKIGVGRQFGNTNVILGLRPYPFNLYLQSTLITTDKGSWIISFEYNPLDPFNGFLSFESQALINVGYRWKIDKNKKNTNKASNN